MAIDFKQLSQKDDLEGINNLFAADGNKLYRLLAKKWFRQGYEMRVNGEPITNCWNNHQRRGYKAHQTVMAAVAEMQVCNA